MKRLNENQLRQFYLETKKEERETYYARITAFFILSFVSLLFWIIGTFFIGNWAFFGLLGLIIFAGLGFKSVLDYQEIKKEIEVNEFK